MNEYGFNQKFKVKEVMIVKANFDEKDKEAVERMKILDIYNDTMC